MIPGLPRSSPLCVLLSTQTEEQKERGGPGNEANTMYGDGTTTVCCDFPNLVEQMHCEDK